MMPHRSALSIRSAARLMALLLTLFATLLLPSALLAAEPATTEAAVVGHWEGAIQLPGRELAIDVDFRLEGEALAADISIPAQGARDLPLGGIAVAGEEITFAIPGVPGDPTFQGTLAADGSEITGSFTQGGAALTFTLSRTASPVDEAEGALAGFAEFVEAARKGWEVPGLALAIVVDGEVVFAEGFGQRDREADLPVTPDTLFPIGSSTKAFTTFTLGTLVDEGKLDWDQPVTRYLPGFRLADPTATELITPRDLVTHRSGLPRHDLVWYNNQGLARSELVARLPYLEPNKTPREKFQYNNLMFLTAGYLIEVLTGKSWEEAVRERILTPLGMERTGFDVAESQRDPDFAQPYEERDEKIVRVPFRPIGNMGPAGSINSSVAEMSRWVLLHLGGGKIPGGGGGDRQLIGRATLADMHSPHMPVGETIERPDIGQSSYGLGWFINTYRGHRRVGHGGNIDGFSALVTLLPDDGIGIVVLTNKGGTRLPELLVRHASDRLLGLKAIEWNRDALLQREQGRELAREAKEKKETARKTGTRPAHDLAEYAGTYHHPGYGDITITPEAEGLTLTYNRIATPLSHWHYEVFNGVEGADDPVFENMKFLFETDVTGEVAALRAPFEIQVGDIVFTKRPDARFFDPDYLARLTGTYHLGPQAITVELAGSTLTATIPGQPQYHLVPVLGERFVIEGISVIHFRFIEGEGGSIDAIQIEQPEGVFTATRAE